MINKAILVGNVGKDPDIRATNSGEKVASFSLATSESWTDKATGERKERTQWHRVVAFGQSADLIERFVQKGTKLYVEAPIEYREWEKEGVKQHVTEIVLRGMLTRFKVLGGGREAARAGSTSAPAAGATRDALDDEVPF